MTHAPNVPETSTLAQALDASYFQIACRQAAATLDRPECNSRMPQAMDLVLSGAVTLPDDGTATVKSGSHTYHLKPECTCQDAQRRSKWCEHFLAAELHRRATALLQGSALAPERAAPSARPPEAPAAAPPAASPAPSSAARTSATWDVHEAPTSACFKFRVHTMELTYTFRGVDDTELTARIGTTLPLLQQIIDACEDRYATRAAEHEAARAAPAQAAQTSAPGQGNDTTQGPPASPSSPTPSPSGDAPDGYCAIHQVPMYLNSNARGSWYSHLALDDNDQEYFCKGRPRRNGR